jgi:hypothetical protein
MRIVLQCRMTVWYNRNRLVVELLVVHDIDVNEQTYENLTAKHMVFFADDNRDENAGNAGGIIDLLPRHGADMDDTFLIPLARTGRILTLRNKPRLYAITCRIWAPS